MAAVLVAEPYASATEKAPGLKKKVLANEKEALLAF